MNQNDHEIPVPPSHDGLPSRDPSLDLLNPESRKVRKGWMVSICDWTWELVALLFSMALLSALLVFMRWYDGSRQTEVILTLNSIVAILSTFLRALLVFILTAVLSQTMWSWFRNPHPVSHINQFHAAVQGTWGALKLFVTVLRPNLALLCVVGLVATYGTGPFTQQAIQSVDCQRVAPGRNASVPVSNFVDMPFRGTLDFSDPADPYNKFTGNAVYGFVTPDMDKLPAIRPRVDCPTGNCTFPSSGGVTHSSLGTCSQCIDISDLVALGTLDLETLAEPPTVIHYTNGTLPNGQKAYNCAGEGNAMALNVASGMDFEWASPLTASHPAFQAALASSFANMTFLSYTKERRYEKGYVSVACTMYPCVHDFSGVVEDGILKEDVVSVTPMTLNYTSQEQRRHEYSMGASHIKMPCVVEGQVYDWHNISSYPSVDSTKLLAVPSPSDPARTVAIPKQCAYLVGSEYGMAINQYFMSNLAGKCACSDSDLESYVHCEGFHQRTDQSVCGIGPCRVNQFPFVLEPFFHQRHTSFENISDIVTSIANATTVRLRLFGKDSAAIPSLGYKDRNITAYGQAASGRVFGTVIETGVCYRIDWMWLLFPCALVLLSSLCLFIIVWESHTMRKNNLPVWKANVLPLLFHGIIGRDNGSHGFQGMVELTEMEKRAEDMNVVFLGDGFYPAKI